MIEAILPPGTVAVDTFSPPPDAMLFPEEESVIRHSVDKRRQEFTAARWCARKAMSELGRPPMPVLPGPRGAPQWPAGLVGSITHCAGYVAAVLADANMVTAVGIDAEPNQTLPAGVLQAVSLPAEHERIELLSREHPGVHWDRLLFSAKESVYKAWFPVTSRWLGFEEADVTFDPVARTFQARLMVTGPFLNGHELTGFSGRFLATPALVLTAIAILTPAHARAGSPPDRQDWVDRNGSLQPRK